MCDIDVVGYVRSSPTLITQEIKVRWSGTYLRILQLKRSRSMRVSSG